MKRFLLVLVSLALIAAGIVIASRPPSPRPNPPGAFSFAVLGDAPYYLWEEWQFSNVLESLDAHDLSFVIHVGDIFWRPCSDAMYRKTLDHFNALRHPVIYTPGDNEWSDCWEAGSGGYAPRERLERIRAIFFASPRLTTQGGEFVENARWERRGIVFATVHLPGSRNAMQPFPNRTAADDAESKRRTLAATEWMRATFREASDARAVVVAFHANPGLKGPRNSAYAQAYEPFVSALEEEAGRFGKPVLIVQGDDHEYVVDRPLRPRNLVRMQVPGSPEVGWVRVIVMPDSTFAFEKHVVPKWKCW